MSSAMLSPTYNPWVVTLSIVIAALASYVALDLASRVRSQDRAYTAVWTVGGAFVMGSGVWSMHFVGMLAFSLPIALSYSLPKTLLSWIAAVAVSGLALHIASRQRLGLGTLIGGALLMGAGICTMHYTGMAALEMAPGIVWNPWLVAASALIACAASAGALLLFFGMRKLRGSRARGVQALAALTMGCAISGMHYTAMAAANFPLGSFCLGTEGLSGTGIGSLIVFATVGLLTITIFTSALDVRLQSQSRQVMEERNARELADAANREKTAFLARMSHELRTPLNAIHGFAELLLHDPQHASPATARQRLALIIDSSRHLLALIDDLLDVSRIELGALEVQVSATEISGIVRAAITELNERACQGEVAISLAQDRPALWATADPIRMHQVVSNLLSNALKYNRPGGSVRIELAAHDEWVRIVVSDTGFGMTTEQLSALYQPFNRLGRRPSSGGTGIGLVITKHLVEGMGGRIDVESRVDEGSRFTVSLRRVSEETRADTAPSGGQLLGGRSDVHGRVLYVEDDPINQILMQSCLALRPGVELLVADSGEAGIEIAVREAFDLMIVDMMLPDMHGADVARRVRERLGFRSPPMIAFSANAMESDIADAMQAGFTDYLVKPAATHQLLAMIDRLLEAGSCAPPATAHRA